MRRRDFFKTAALGGGAVALNPVISCMPVNRQKEEQKKFNPDFTLDEISVDGLQKKMQNNEMTSEDIINLYLDRIREIDTSGPELKSVIEINPDAAEIARQLDQERADGSVRGPLHGIPVIIKDNIDSADKMQTTAGSLALSGFHAPEDAFIVERLRENGAVLLAKANLSEWANIRSTRSSSGWSGRGGQVRNPYILDRTPCGSSSGSAVSVAANLTTLAIGTETDGSVVCPSAINGIVGIKPTLGLWSRHGIIPIAHSQDTAGPMARTVSDAACLLGALTGLDDFDPASMKSRGQALKDYSGFLEKDGLSGARLGIIRDFHGFDPNVDKLMQTSYQKMKDQGASLIDVDCAKNRDEWGNAEWTVLLYELKHDLNFYLSERPGTPINTLDDLIRFNEENTEKEMPWFGQEIFIEANKKGGLNETEYLEALETSKRLSQAAVNETMEKHNLNALLAPTNAPAWCVDWVNGDHFVGGSSDLAAVSGYPSITVPAGYVHGLPVGLSFFSKAWDEPTLIKLAYSYEQTTKYRKKPTFAAALRDLQI